MSLGKPRQAGFNIITRIFGGHIESQVNYTLEPAEIESGKENRVRTTLSDIEWIRNYLKTNRLPKKPNEFDIRNEGVNEAAERGLALHELDVILSLITQNIPIQAIQQTSALTSPRAEIELLRESLGNLHIYKGMTERQVAEVFMTAWQNYFDHEGRLDPATIPIFKDLGFTDPIRRENYVYGDKLKKSGFNLARAWAQEIFQPRQAGVEFKRSQRCLNEILVVANLPEVQLLVRFDKIVFDPQEKSYEPFTSVINFKSSRSEISEDRAIVRNQAMTEWLLGDIFAKRYLPDAIGQHEKGRAFMITLSLEEIEQWFALKKQEIKNRAASSRFYFREFRDDNKFIYHPLDKYSNNIHELDEFKKWLYSYIWDISENKFKIREAKRKLKPTEEPY